MKFLVLALCVCAASAASFGSVPFGGFKKYNGFEAPAVAAAKAVATVSAPVVAPVVKAANTVYSAAGQVVNKPYSQDVGAAVVRSESEVSPDGFRYSYETDNGIVAEAVGNTKQVGESAAVVSQGSYRYVSPDGTPVVVTYIADETGFHPQSDSLPVAPEIPEAIARSIAYNIAHASLNKN